MSVLCLRGPEIEICPVFADSFVVRLIFVPVNNYTYTCTFKLRRPSKIMHIHHYGVELIQVMLLDTARHWWNNVAGLSIMKQ